MSNPFAKTFEELRSPFLQEKMAKKDYDGDGKIETGTQEYMGSRDKAIKKAMGKDPKKEMKKEHHQKDADGKVIEHGDGTPSSVEEISYTAAYLPSNVDEAKIDQGMSTDQKRAARNERSGRKDKPERGGFTGKKISKRHISRLNQSYRKDSHEARRGVKKERGKMTLKDRAGLGRGMTRDNQLKNIMNKSTSVKKDGNNIQFSHYEPQGELVDEMITLTKGDYGSRNVVGSAYHTAKTKGFDKKIYKAGGGLGANFLPLANSYEPPKVAKPNFSNWREDFVFTDEVEEAVKRPKLDIQEKGVKNKIEVNPDDGLKEEKKN